MKKQQQKDVLLASTGALLTKSAKKIPYGYHIGRGGYLEQDDDGNSNGESSGNGNGNGGSSGGGNGGSGNGGGGE